MRDAVLWKLSFENASESYLFGTMHVRDRVAFQYVNKALEYIDKCDRYYAEIDLKEAATKIRPEDYMLPGNLSWDTLYSPRQYERMCNHCRNIMSFELEEWTRYYPLVVSNKIAESIMTQDQDLALDAFLFMKAIEMGKETAGVEPVEFQLQLMKSLDINGQLSMLKKICSHLSKYKSHVESLKEDYKNQDILSLYRKTRNSLGAMRKALLKERNMTMAETILNCPPGTNFFAVGAAHLAGPYGVLRILKQNSIELQPLTLKII